MQDAPSDDSNYFVQAWTAEFSQALRLYVNGGLLMSSARECARTIG